MAITWAMVLAVMIQYLGPVLLSWLESLLTKTFHNEDLVPTDLNEFKEHLRLGFDTMHKSLPRTAVFRRRAMARTYHAVMIHAEKIYAAAKDPTTKIEPIGEPMVHSLKAEIATAANEQV